MENKGERHNWFAVRGNRGVSDCEGDGQRAGIILEFGGTRISSLGTHGVIQIHSFIHSFNWSIPKFLSGFDKG